MRYKYKPTQILFAGQIKKGFILLYETYFNEAE